MTTKPDAISPGRLTTLSLFALLSQFCGYYIAHTAAVAGAAGFLSPFFAMLPAMGVSFLLAYMYKKRPLEPLPVLLRSLLGRFAGSIVLIAYAAWCLLHGAMALRQFGDRSVTLLFTQSHFSLFMLLLAAVALVASRGRLSTLSRTGVVCLGMCLLGFVLLIVFSLSNTKADNLWPLVPKDIVGVLRSGLLLSTLFGGVVYAGFLSGRVNKREETGAKSVRPILLFAAAAAALIAFTYGVFSARLTARIQNPFLAATKNVSGLDGTARLESVIFSLWTLPDFLYVSLMVTAAAAILSDLLRVKEPKTLILPLSFLLFTAALTLVATGAEWASLSSTVLFWGDLALQFGVPLGAFAIGKARRRL